MFYDNYCVGCYIRTTASEGDMTYGVSMQGVKSWKWHFYLYF